MPYYGHREAGTLPTQHLKAMSNQSRATLNPTRTAAEKAAFKAANLAAKPQGFDLWPAAPAARKSQRQQFTADLRETEDMIRAAKRQGLLQAIPALIARHNQLTQLANHAAIS